MGISRTKWILVSGAALASFVTPNAAWAQQRTFDLPAQPATKSIPEFARQAGIQIVAPGGKLRGIRTPRLKGAYDVRAALRILLQNSGLRVAGDDGSTITLAAAQGAVGQPEAAPPTSVGASGITDKNEEPGDIVVTAQKRLERQLDVPVPVSVISASSLTDSNQVGIEDYYTRIPGVNINPTGFGGPQVVLRGITTGGYANPTVGVVIDDVPFGSSTNIGGLGSVIPDLDPSTLSQIEVLRGPQGTLYGASAMGGLLKFVTADPSTKGVSGQFGGGISGTAKGSDVGYNLRGSLNLPVSQNLAIAASGFTRFDPGYIDDIQTGRKDVNGLYVQGGRVATMWKPSEDVSLKLSALIQHEHSNGADEVDPTLGDLRQDKLRDTGGINKLVQLYTGSINANLGAVTLVSVTGYGVNDATVSSDYTPFYGGSAQSIFGVGGAPLLQSNLTKKLTQEVRLNGSFGTHIDWLLGGFYMNERSRVDQNVPAVDPTTDVSQGILYAGNTHSRVQEIAVFGDVTVRLSDKLDIQVGARQSFIRQRQDGIQSGALFNDVTTVTPTVSSKAEPFTYLFTPRLKLTPDVMIYARLASGYRVGGPNPNITLLNLPRSFGPDKTQNYEIGLKGAVLNRRLTFDLSLYYIDWKDIQLYAVSNGFSFYSNGGRARSQGIEVSTEARPTRGLDLSGWITYGDAELRGDLPPSVIAGGLYGQAGDRLPQSARFAAGFSIDQDFALTDSISARVGASYSYQGNRPGDFAASSSAARVMYPAYSRVDLRAGLTMESWKVNLFANNIFDRRAALAQAIVPGNFLYLRPRTIGVNLVKTF